MNTIKVVDSNNIRILTISRPEALNALNRQVFDELDKAFSEIIQSRDLLGVVLTGDGEKAFVAGADIKEFTSLTPTEAFELSRRGHALFKKIENCPKPVIAAINGFALGGGCELAMACHLRIASQNAKFGQPEVNLGLIPGYGGTQRLAQLVGRGKALELMLTGEIISADEAKAIGLINHIVPNKEELLSLTLKILEKISRKAPIAIRYVIESVNAGYEYEEAGYNAEAKNFSTCTTTKDFKEGTMAFLEKRQPNFKGE
jgi:enoyl-CoA hydratase